MMPEHATVFLWSNTNRIILARFFDVNPCPVAVTRIGMHGEGKYEA
jgi:hypothetical protein